MPPKKKKGGKGGGKKKKGKKEEAPVEEESEYDNMDMDMLCEVVPMLKVQLEKQKLDRNYVQLERDTIQTFFDITRKDVNMIGHQISMKDREAEKMEEEHRMEVRVYVQKVKHREYEHQQSLKNAEIHRDNMAEDAGDENDGKVANLNQQKKSLKMEFKEQAWVHTEAIKERMHTDQRNLEMMRKDFEKKMSEIQERCDRRQAQLEEDLQLRRKVHIHEIEERKNLHINDLMRNHERAFGQMKSYYNDITNDNLQLIRSLKDQVSEMKLKQVANQKLMFDISNENRLLREPLTIAVAEVASLRAQLKDRAKDRLSLRNGKARKQVFGKRVAELRGEHNEMKAEMEGMQKERDFYYVGFEDAIKDMQQKSELGNVILEQQIQRQQQDAEAAEVQVEQITAAAGLDKGELAKMNLSIAEALKTRNGMIHDLEYQLIRLRKGFNDSLATQSKCMANFGVPHDEIDSMGFVPFQDKSAVSAPAGLVAGGKKPL